MMWWFEKTAIFKGFFSLASAALLSKLFFLIRMVKTEEHAVEAASSRKNTATAINLARAPWVLHLSSHKIWSNWSSWLMRASWEITDRTLIRSNRAKLVDWQSTVDLSPQRILWCATYHLSWHGITQVLGRDRHWTSEICNIRSRHLLMRIWRQHLRLGNRHHMQGILRIRRRLNCTSRITLLHIKWMSVLQRLHRLSNVTLRRRILRHILRNKPLLRLLCRMLGRHGFGKW